MKSTEPVENIRIDYQILRLRAAIGIQSADFTLSEADYYQLYSFDPPNVYELSQAYDVFKESCKQVRAKYPSRAVFERIYRRYDAEIEADFTNIAEDE